MPKKHFYVTQIPSCVILFASFSFCLIATQSLAFDQGVIVDSIKQEWVEKEIGEKEMNYLFELFEENIVVDSEVALSLANYGIELGEAKGEDLWSAKFYRSKAISLQKLSRYDDALDAINNAIANSESAGNTEILGKSMDSKAVVLIDQGDYHGGMQLYMEVLQQREEAGDDRGIAYSNMKLSEILFFLERYEESAKYGEKAVELCKAIGDHEYLVQAYEQAALALTTIGQADRGLAYMDAALAVIEENDMPMWLIGSIQNSRGNVLRKFDRYEEAIKAYDAAYEIASQLNFESGAAASLGNIGDVYYEMGKFQEALPFRKRAVEMKEKNGLYVNYTENLLQLSALYKETGDYENALLYTEKVLYFRDSTFNKEKEAITQELTTRYETVQKEEELAQNAREQNLLYAIIALMVLGLCVLIWAFVQKQKSNKILAALNEQKAFLIKEVHHRVKNNLQVISSLLQFQSRSIADTGIKAALLDSQSRVRSMSLIHQKLYRGTHLAAIEMKSYLENLAETLIDAYSDEDSVDVVLDMESLELDVDYAIPLGLIANELVTNSLKYAFPNNRHGAVSIKLQQEESDLILHVSDNGVGKSVSVVDDPNKGFGSELIDMLRLQLKGELVESSGSGFEVKFKFPYRKSA